MECRKATVSQSLRPDLVRTEKVAPGQRGESTAMCLASEGTPSGESDGSPTADTTCRRVKIEVVNAMIFDVLLPPYQLDLLRHAQATQKPLELFLREYVLFWGWPDARLSRVLTLCYCQGCDFMAKDAYVRDLLREGVEPNPGPFAKRVVKGNKFKVKLIKPPRAAVQAAVVDLAVAEANERAEGHEDALRDMADFPIAAAKPKRAPQPSADVKGIAKKLCENVYCNVQYCQPKWYTHLATPAVGILCGMLSYNAGALASTATALFLRPLMRVISQKLTNWVLSKYSGSNARSTLGSYVSMLNMPRSSPFAWGNWKLGMAMKLANMLAYLAGGQQIIGLAKTEDSVVVKNAVDVRHSSANSSKVDMEPLRIQRMSYLNFNMDTTTTLFVEPCLAAECCAYSCLTDNLAVESMRRKAYSNTQLNLPVVLRGALTSDTTVFSGILKSCYSSAGMSVYDLNGMWGREVILSGMATVSTTLLFLLPPIRRTTRSACTRLAKLLIAKFTCILLGQF